MLAPLLLYCVIVADIYQDYPDLCTRLLLLLLDRARRPTPDTLVILKRTPGISPLAWPDRPNPDTSTSSFSSTKLRQPSRGTKAVTFLPFLISSTRTDLRIAELGCLASMPTFSSTMALACDEPPKGLDLRAVPKFFFL